MQMLDPDDVIIQTLILNKPKLAHAIDLLFSPKNSKKNQGNIRSNNNMGLSETGSSPLMIALKSRDQKRDLLLMNIANLNEKDLLGN